MKPDSNTLPDEEHDPKEQARLAALHAWLDVQLAQASPSGLPFDVLMQAVLYHPQFGYYLRPRSPIGASGDFITAPEVSPWFARTLANEIRLAMRASGIRRVVEFGAGNGTLARQLLDAWTAAPDGLVEPRSSRESATAAETELPLQYDIIEISPTLRARQQTELAAHARAGKCHLRWLGALEPGAQALVLANEVLDALPVKLLCKRAHGWVEQYVGRVMSKAGNATGMPTLGLLDAPSPLAAAALPDILLTQPLPLGYLTEWHVGARDWIAALGAHLARGAVWLIDYGYPEAEYYTPTRTTGTLCAHWRHRRVDEPLWRLGACDLTAHVNFTQVALDAEATGFEICGYTSQARYLLNAGLLELMGSSAASTTAAALSNRGNRGNRTTVSREDQAALLTLLSESDMGERFKVMVLGRGLPELEAQAFGIHGFHAGDRTHLL